MSALGLPILGDPLYPVVTGPVPAGDFRRPLQLLARVLEFTDPVTGNEHRFLSERVLTAWSSYEDWVRVATPPAREDRRARPAQEKAQ